MKKYYVVLKLGSTQFDTTKSVEGEVEHDSYTYYKEDFGAGHWFGGAGYLANPPAYEAEMAPFEVSKEAFEQIWGEASEATNDPT